MPERQPTPAQRWTGHAIVGVGVSVGVHKTAKPHPLVSVAIGVFAAWIHERLDAPVSQVIAAIAP
ncbi:MAG: hypothetical protein ACYC1I_04270 [Acidimicrobiales bacterium]